MDNIKNKKNSYLIKLILSLIILRLKKIVYYFARYTAIIKFNRYLKKLD